MSLYDSIAASYELIFPVRAPKIAYAADLAERAGGTVLDIGCATGTLALELARAGLEVTGIDLDADMIRMAQDRAREQGLAARFSVLDMRDVGKRFGRASLDLILCLGNTIVHLPDQSAIAAFLGSCAGLLAASGRLAVQLVSYDRVISGEHAGFPTIENEHVRFSRSYRYDRELRRVRFTTELTVKATGRVQRDETTLYPLTHSELRSLLPSSGLEAESFLADFSGRRLTPADESFVAVLTRARA